MKSLIDQWGKDVRFNSKEQYWESLAKNQQTLQWLKSSLKVKTNGLIVSHQIQVLSIIMCTLTSPQVALNHEEQLIISILSNSTIMKKKWKQKKNRKRCKNYMARKKRKQLEKKHQIFCIWVTMMVLCFKILQKVGMSIMINS